MEQEGENNDEWVEGFFVENHFSVSEYRECFIRDLEGTMYKVIPETVGQYTGLTDKNGTKIFESDVIKIEFQQDFYIGEIYWADDFLGWIVKFLDGTTPETMELINFYNTKYVEVIGNVYDNSELLKG